MDIEIKRNYLTSKLDKDNLVSIISRLSIEELKVFIQSYPEIQCNEAVWLKLLQLEHIDYQGKNETYYSIYLTSFYEKVWTGYIEESTWNRKETIVARTLKELYYKIGQYIIRNGRLTIIKFMLKNDPSYRTYLESIDMFNYFFNHGFNLNYFLNIDNFRTMDNDIEFYNLLSNYIYSRAQLSIKIYNENITSDLPHEFILITPEGQLNFTYQQHKVDM